MKYIFTLLLTFGTLTTFSQTIDYSHLTGTWFCYKAIQPSKNNPDLHIANYFGSRVSFYSDSTFSESGLYATYITTSGTYNLNKNNNRLSFKDFTDRTRDPYARALKEKYKYMSHYRPDEIIVSLSKDTLIILELPADTIFYYRE
jgi:hypothetical protein